MCAARVCSALRLAAWVCAALLLGPATPAAAAGPGVFLVSASGQKAMLADPGTTIAGAHDADLRIIEFFDYNCPYCKKMAPTFAAFLAQDHKAALVYKEWPIFGDASTYAAKSALAAQWLGKYLIAHDALMQAPNLSSSSDVDAALKGAGLDPAAIARERTRHAVQIDALLARSEDEARALGLRGTPGIVVGRLLLPGIVDLEGLKKLAEAARRER